MRNGVVLRLRQSASVNFPAFRKSIFQFLTSTALLLAACTIARANVGINFVGGSTVNGSPAGLGPNETAGVVPQQFWNNAETFTLTVNGGSASDGNSRGALNAIQIVETRFAPAPPAGPGVTAPKITSQWTASGAAHVPFRYVITADQNPTSYGATGLPPGLTVDPSTGVISGAPHVSGSFDVTITASNAAGTGSSILMLVITTSPLSLDSRPTGNTEQLNTASFLNLHTGCAAGANGTLLTTLDGGINWSKAKTGFNINLNSVRFVDTAIYLTGENGLIARSLDGGKTWVALESGTTLSLNSSSFVNAERGFAVGAQGTIVLYNGGGRWQSQQSGSTYDLHGVFAIDELAYAVGASGAIYRFDGTRWTAQISGAPNITLFDTAFVTRTFGYAVGENGTVCRTVDGGLNWTRMNTGTTATLRSIRIIDMNNAIAVGANGTILRTYDGGVSWSVYSIGSDNLTGVEWVGGRGFACGTSGVIYVIAFGQIPSNLPPSVTITGPLDRTEKLVCIPFSISASAGDPDGTIAKVEFFNGATKIGEDRTAPYQISWKIEQLDPVVLIAKATDNRGSVSLSPQISVKIVPPPANQLVALGVNPNGEFELCFGGVSGQSYTLQASTDLQYWLDLGPLISANGLWKFADGPISTKPYRFYRVQRQ